MTHTHLQNRCPVCDKLRVYKTKNGWQKGAERPCKSCSNSICRGGKGNVLPLNGVKVCFRCKIEKSKAEFYWHPSKKRYHSLCNQCKLLSFREYQKSKGRFDRHGLTKEQYDQMLDMQNGKCYICNITPDVLCIDHDHTTGQIRKLLCSQCNSALGMIKEDISVLTNMIKYLEKFRGY